MKRAASALLLATLVFLGLALPALGHGAGVRDVALVYVLDGVSFEQAMVVEDLRGLASLGGVGLMTTPPDDEEDRERRAFLTVMNGIEDPEGDEATLLERLLLGAVVAVCRHETLIDPVADPCGTQRTVANFDHALFFDLRGQGADEALLQALGQNTEDWIRFIPGHVLVVVVAPAPSPEMDRVGDEVTPLIVAGSLGTGTSPEALLALRSDTTRRDGLVAAVDMAPTIVQFFGFPIPPEMQGSPIEVSDREAPFAPHRRHLEQRRIRLPVQLAELAFLVGATVAVLAALARLWVGGSLSPRLAGAARFAILCGLALVVAVAAGGLLPRLTYAWVVPFLVMATTLLASLALTSRWPGPTGPVSFLGVVGVAFLVLDLGFFGGRALGLPLLGGTMFDGVRFYGLPNSFIALLLGSGLFLAARLRPFTGFLLLLALGLFAGFPSLGANIGGAFTLFVAAGAWWVVRTRRRLGWRGVAFVAGVAALGLAAVLLANRWLPGAPTHAGRFLEGAGGGLDEAWRTLAGRLEVGVSMVGDVPAAVIPLIGLAVVLALALRPLGPVARGLSAAGEPWRQAVAVVAAASLVSFVANDTGVAAAAPGFIYALGGLLYPAFLPEATNGRRLERYRDMAPANA